MLSQFLARLLTPYPVTSGFVPIVGWASYSDFIGSGLLDGIRTVGLGHFFDSWPAPPNDLEGRARSLRLLPAHAPRNRGT